MNATGGRLSRAIETRLSSALPLAVAALACALAAAPRANAAILRYQFFAINSPDPQSQPGAPVTLERVVFAVHGEEAERAFRDAAA